LLALALPFILNFTKFTKEAAVDLPKSASLKRRIQKVQGKERPVAPAKLQNF
jgi:hypothetical protein